VRAEAIGDFWRRAADANREYLASVGDLTASYGRALAGLAAGALERSDVVRRRPERRSAGARPAEAAPARDAAPAATMVLEAPAGEVAVGAFLVENALRERTEAVVRASAFVAADGAAVVPELVYEPPVVTLEPGQQAVVRVGARIPGDLRAGNDYAGELSVPGLPGTRIPVVLRRRVTGDGGG
jgi:hypothetical protein